MSYFDDNFFVNHLPSFGGDSQSDSLDFSLDSSGDDSDDLATEVMGLSHRLAERQRQHNQRVAETTAQSLHYTSMAGSAPQSPTRPSAPASASGWVVPPVFNPEPSSRVAAEVSAVTHMLNTAAFWLASVDISSVPADAQQDLFRVAETCLAASLRFPAAQALWEGPMVRNELVHPTSQSGSNSALAAAEPQRAPSDSSQRHRRKRRHHRN